MRLLHTLILLSMLIPGVARAQDAPQDAAALPDSVNLEQRLTVKPVVEAWLEQAMRASTASERDAWTIRAGALARAFQDTYGESSLMVRVEAARTWSAEQRAVKLHADSLYDEAFARRSDAETRGEAHALYLQALELYRGIGDLAGEAETLGQLGYVNWWLDPERALYRSWNEQALEKRRELGDLQLVGNSLNDLGVYHRVISREPERALAYYLEAEGIRWNIGDSLAQSRMIPNIALSYEALGDYDAATTYFQKGAELYIAVGDTARSIGQRNNAIGLLTDYMEMHSDALVELLRLKSDLRAINDARAEALVSNSMGIVYRRLGDFESAIQHYQEVIRLAEEHDLPDLLASAQNNIGVVFIWTGRPDRAVPWFERSLGLSREQDDPEGELNAMVNLGSAHFESREYQQSLDFLDQARTLADTLSSVPTLGTIHTGLGNALLRSGRPDAATEQYMEALDIAREWSLPELEIGALFGLGDVAEQSGQADQAYAWYEQGFGAMESTRGLLRASEDKAGWLAQSRYLFEDVVDFLTQEAIHTGDSRWTEAAFNVSEMARARAFSDQLAESIARIDVGVDAELLSDQQILTDNLVYLRQELLDAPDAAARAALKAQIREQEQEFDRVERALREQNPAYADLRYPDPIDLAGLQGTLRPGQVVLAYAVGDSSSTLWAISPDQADIHLLPVRSDLSTRIDVLRFALQDPARVSPAQYAETAGQLHDILIGPASDLVAAASHVTIIADDALHYVPFDALVVEPGTSWATHRYLVNDAAVSYVQSASVLQQLSGRVARAPSKQLLAIGNPDFGGTNTFAALRGASLAPLPFTGDEVRAISGVFDVGSVDVLTGDDATEAAVRERVAGDSYRFVHFATHGLIDDDRPDFSALALTRGASRGEGLLQASEIFNLRIPSDVVVLSACETGLGQLIQGEGMVGLTRAFMYAGAASVVASLWSVADATTAELMTHLYAGMITDGEPVADALRASKRTMLADETTAHPFYWAPFVHFGAHE
ncbi:MAG: CHAT domain-containing tetratricopeptide repeat protein [Rhodothermales bacterium]